jgi:hypothetical protein
LNKRLVSTLGAYEVMKSWFQAFAFHKRAANLYRSTHRKTREQLATARRTEAAVGAAAAVLGPRAWRQLEQAVVARVAAELPTHLPLVYAYSDQALDLETTLR